MTFQSTHLLRGATKTTKNAHTAAKISIHAPLARCDKDDQKCPHSRPNFNPRTSCEVRRPGHRRRPGHCHFNPRTSCEVRQSIIDLPSVDFYFNPRTSCEVRLVVIYSASFFRSISIHAPLARCDRLLGTFNGWLYYFNPRTSCEVRPRSFLSISKVWEFQSTHLLRGATLKIWVLANKTRKFQSTHLLRGATAVLFARVFVFVISIHAPLARCDRRPGSGIYLLCDFNPRTSCEVRQTKSWKNTSTKTFQSTHLLRGATAKKHKIAPYFLPILCTLYIFSEKFVVFLLGNNGIPPIWGAISCANLLRKP